MTATISHYITTDTPPRARVRRNADVEVVIIGDPAPVRLPGGWEWFLHVGPCPIANGPHAMRGTTRTHTDALESACAALRWLADRGGPLT